MKRLMGKKALWRMVVALVLGSVLFVGATPILAAGGGAPPPQDGVDERIAPRLELAYQRLLLAADVHAVHLDHTADLAERVQEWIDFLAGEGEDVSDLQAALDAFKAAAAESEGYYQEAQTILEAHAGFDDEGRVIDREQAVETLRKAGQALRDARRTLKDGTIQLRRAFGEWRREHRPQPTEP